MNYRLLGLLALPLAARAQQPLQRIEDFNAVGWFVYQGDHALGSHFVLHTEAQLRRTHLVTDWQQSLFRAGLGYRIMPRLTGSAGYTYLTTYQYGNHPRADAGAYPEQRLYADLQLSDQIGWALLDHRVRYDLRYIGIPGASGPLSNDAVWSRQNRLRYQLQLRFPLQGATLDDNEWYFAGFDEVFLNFGRIIGANAFDQNRVALGFGYRFSEDFQLEAQYLNQILEQNDLDRRSLLPVYEFINGFRVGLTYNLTLIAPKPEAGPGDVRE